MKNESQVDLELPVKYSEMGGFPVDHSDQPIRLFKSDLLEFFTHITPQAIVIIWLPVILWFLARSIREFSNQPSFLSLPLAILIGLLLWTLTEYILHRFVFHYHPTHPSLKRLVFLFHGIHHAQPQSKTRLVMPPIVSIPMAFIFYTLFAWVFGTIIGWPHWVDPLFVGFGIGYLLYDLIHYATHHYPIRSGFLKTIKRHHMQHHYKSPDKRFGVSSPFWDVIFATLPE